MRNSKKPKYNFLPGCLPPLPPGCVGRMAFPTEGGQLVVSTEVFDDGRVVIHDQSLHNRLLTPGGMQSNGSEPDDKTAD